MSDFERLQKDIVEFRDERDWQQFHNPKDLSMSIVLEASELMEHFQWKNPDEVVTVSEDRKEEIGEEMADVFNYLLLLAHELEIDLIDVTARKLEKTREKYPVDKAKGTHKKYTELAEE